MRRRSFGFVVLLLLGCNDEGPSGTVGDTVMRVILSTEGAFLDPDGYDVTVDGSVVRGVALDDDLTLPNVTPGETRGRARGP